MGFRWLLGYSQVGYWLGDHFATTVTYLWASCALSVAIVCQMFMPLYIIVMPYLRHFGSFVPKNCLRLIVVYLNLFLYLCSRFTSKVWNKAD